MVKWHYKIREIVGKTPKYSSIMVYCEIVKWRILKSKRIEEIVYDFITFSAMEFRNFNTKNECIKNFEYYQEFQDFLKHVCKHKSTQFISENKNIRIEFLKTGNPWYRLEVTIYRKILEIIEENLVN